MLWQSGTPGFIKPTAKDKKKVDIYIERLVTQQFSAEGEPVYRLRADRAQHWQDNDETHLVEPQILYFAPQVWYTKAHTGIIHPDAEKITLKDFKNLKEQLKFVLMMPMQITFILAH